jgi:hypothetical protein
VIKVKGLEPIDFATVSQLAHYHSATTVALHIRGPQWVDAVEKGLVISGAP